MDVEAYEERAAILEFCGGMPRAMAEARARRELSPPAAPTPMPAADKATPSYLAFREFWHREKSR